MQAFQHVRVLAAHEGKVLSLGGGLAARFMLSGADTRGTFSLVEHPLAPGFLGAPMHTHRNEDEYSFVLEGEVGIQVGEEVVTAGPGTLVCKPRGVPHTFWNPGTVPARFLEIISPAGFERFFEEVGQYFPEDGPEDMPGFLALCARYELSMDLESVPLLHEKYNLKGM